jgi:hypothetical protein
VYTTTTTTTTTTKTITFIYHKDIGPLLLKEVSVAFKLFIETGLLCYVCHC